MSNPILPNERKLMEEIRNMYLQVGTAFSDQIDDWGMNQYHGSKDGKTYLLFYWDSVHDLITPNGSHPVTGRRTMGDESSLLPELIRKFGLVLVSETNRNHEKWSKYQVTNSDWL